MYEPFAELALLLLIAAAVGALAVRLRQPVLIAYIVVGIAVGAAGLGMVKAHDQIDLLAQIGVTLLLFLVGLKSSSSCCRTNANSIRCMGALPSAS